MIGFEALEGGEHRLAVRLHHAHATDRRAQRIGVHGQVVDAIERLYTINGVKGGFPSRSFERRGYKSDDKPWRRANHPEWDWKSTTSSDEAIRTALERASASMRNIRWFEVLSTRGHVENGKVAYWQVTLKVGFTLDE